MICITYSNVMVQDSPVHVLTVLADVSLRTVYKQELCTGTKMFIRSIIG